MSLAIDPQAVQSLREILGDTDAENPVYSEMALIESLRQHRETVYVRNPYVLTTGLRLYLPWKTRVPIPPTELHDSLLLREPDGMTYHAQSHVRFWDAKQSIQVWVQGLLVDNTNAAAYTVDYPNGRITFAQQVDDWKPVLASFAYYKIYHAARFVIGAFGWAKGRVLSFKVGNDTYTFATPSEAIAVFDAMIASIAPKSARVNRKLY